jgi:hypothetical protein
VKEHQASRHPQSDSVQVQDKYPHVHEDGNEVGTRRHYLSTQSIIVNSVHPVDPIQSCQIPGNGSPKPIKDPQISNKVKGKQRAPVLKLSAKKKSLLPQLEARGILVRQHDTRNKKSCCMLLDKSLRCSNKTPSHERVVIDEQN